MSSILSAPPASSLNKSIVELFSDSNISMLSSKQGPIFPKRIYKPKRAFGKYFGTEGLVSLLVMILIRYKSEMGWKKYAWKKEGRLCYPASVYIPRHSIQEQGSISYFITTRYQSTTVINYNHMQCSDVNLFWKIQYPTTNDLIYDTFERHCSSATTKKRFNVDDSTTDPSSHSVKPISKPDPVFEHLDYNLLSMTAQPAPTVTIVIFALDHMNQEEQAMASIAHVDIACNMGRLSQKQYSRPAQQLSRNGRQCRKAT
jgi:hypothetical protein